MMPVGSMALIAIATQQDIVRAEDGRLLVADFQDIGIENQ